jgi:hypothetical protein
MHLHRLYPYNNRDSSFGKTGGVFKLFIKTLQLVNFAIIPTGFPNMGGHSAFLN